jgi:DNA-binding CsgD family transcriptional regulator
MRKRVTPYLWEGTGAANDEYTRRFLVHSARYGIRSSVVVTLQNGAAGQIVLTFNSSASPVTAERRECFLASLGDLVLIAMGLHEFVLARHLVKAAPCKYPGLTPRERECLKFAACGLTSADIGNKLSLTERTVNFHFSRLRQKLGALNRPEAIARGVSLGYVTLD